MSYNVKKIKKYSIPDTLEKKSMIFLVPDLFGPDTDYRSPASRGRHSGGGKPEARAPGNVVRFLLY
jgi:hypothetical protein